MRPERAVRRDATIVSVSGGVAGVAARWDQLRGLAAAYDLHAERLRGQARLGVVTMADADLLASAALSPSTFAAAEGAVLAATTGPEGLLPRAWGWQADAASIRVALGALELADEVTAAGWDTVDYLLGRVLGLGLGQAMGRAAGGTVVAAAAALALWPHLPPARQERIRRGAAGAAQDAERFLTRHPAVARHVVNGAGGLVEGAGRGVVAAGLPLLPLVPLLPDTGSVARLLAAAYGPETAHRTRPVPGRVPRSDVQPDSVADLVQHAREVSTHSSPEHPEHNGTFEVQTLTDADGSRRHIVILPGSDDMATLPWSQDHDARDMAGNLREAGGQGTVAARAVVDALEQSGVRPGEPVLVVGHSQGGMTAAQVAAAGSAFDVSHVVTAGSPSGHVDVPAGTEVLSVDNVADVVPLTTGELPEDSRHHVRVGFEADDRGIAGNHDFHSYAAGADAVDGSDHPSVRAALDGLRRAGFLGSGAEVSSQMFQVTRAQ